MSIDPFLNASNAHVKTYICLCTETQASIGVALCLDPTSPLAKKKKLFGDRVSNPETSQLTGNSLTVT